MLTSKSSKNIIIQKRQQKIDFKEIDMTFDQDPADDYEHYQCERCGGSIRLSGDKSLWECDTCDFQVRNKKEGE